MDRDEAAKMREREARAARADRYKAVLEEIRDLQEEGFQSLTDQAMYYAEARELAILALGDPLAAVLDEIRQIEESEGFEGPKIAQYMLERRILFRDQHVYDDVWQDHVVGEIGRACDERGWRFLSDHNFDTRGKYVYLVKIFCGSCAHGALESNLALAAARAYRDALKASYP